MIPVARASRSAEIPSVMRHASMRSSAAASRAESSSVSNCPPASSSCLNRIRATSDETRMLAGPSIDRSSSIGGKALPFDNRPSSLSDRPSSLSDRPSSLADRPSSLADKPLSLADKLSSLSDKPFSLADKPSSFRSSGHDDRPSPLHASERDNRFSSFGDRASPLIHEPSPFCASGRAIKRASLHSPLHTSSMLAAERPSPR